MTKLDYSLKTPEERLALVNQILEENPNPTEKYLEVLSDYVIIAADRQKRKEDRILTDNRMTTINKRETSFEGLVSQFENGEDGIYNLITEDKNIIFQHKVQITPEDLEEIPYLRQIKEAIEELEALSKTLTGRDAYVAKKAIIELRKDQYIVKNAFRKPVMTTHLNHGFVPTPLNCTEEIVDGEIKYSGVSLMDPKVCSAILCNYSKLKQSGYSVFQGDTWYLMEDFDKISAEALKDYPLYEALVTYKIDGLQNIEIQKKLEEDVKKSQTKNLVSNNVIEGATTPLPQENQYEDWSE